MILSFRIFHELVGWTYHWDRLKSCIDSGDLDLIFNVVGIGDIILYSFPKNTVLVFI